MSSSPHQVLELRFEIVYAHVTSRINVQPLWKKWLAVEGAEDRFKKAFMQGVHPALKPLLIGDNPPSIEDLVTLGWDDRDDMFGVYFKVLIAQTEGKHNHLYVGSATGLGGKKVTDKSGLQGRRQSHEWKMAAKKHDYSTFNAIYRRAKDSYNLHFVTAFTRPLGPKPWAENEVIRHRQDSILIEALLTHWLFAAYDHTARSPIPAPSFWPKNEAYDYYGSNSVSPLVQGFILTVSFEAGITEEEREEALKTRRKRHNDHHNPVKNKQFKEDTKLLQAYRQQKGEGSGSKSKGPPTAEVELRRQNQKMDYARRKHDPDYKAKRAAIDKRAYGKRKEQLKLAKAGKSGKTAK